MNNNHLSIVDLIRIGLMSKDFIDSAYMRLIKVSKLSAGSVDMLLGVHVVGKKLLYLNNQKTNSSIKRFSSDLLLLSEDLYVMYGICSIRMPSSLQDMRLLIANAEDLLPIRRYFKSVPG